jgi:hypothetical protein
VCKGSRDGEGFPLEESSERPIHEKRHPGRLHDKDHWEQEQFPGNATLVAFLFSLAFWAAVGYGLWFFVLR